jgi:hypothetical protein
LRHVYSYTKMKPTQNDGKIWEKCGSFLRPTWEVILFRSVRSKLE